MKSVLITAFEPYDRWTANASWLALVELTRNLPQQPAITTRLYPVDFATLPARLGEDLAANHDVVLHLGQAPGSGRIRLEMFAVNIGGHRGEPPDDFRPLAPDGPAAYRTSLPLEQWAGLMRQAGIPAQVSHHAGTYLCNAAMYLTHHLIAQQKLRSQAAFIHFPLATSQTIDDPQDLPSLPAEVSAAALRLILEDLVGNGYVGKA